jgi:hypothetical protein
MPTGRARAAVALLGVLLVLLAGCSGSEVGSPAPGEASPQAGPDREALARFAETCDQKVDTFRPAQVDYPATLPARLDQPTTYVAGLDIRDRPAPPTEYLPGESRTARPIAVQCVVAAQLSAVTSGIEVEAVPSGWRFAEFNETGLISFSWSVTPRSTARQELRLELKPAVQSVLSQEFGSADSMTFPTAVDVSASAPQRMSEWVETNFGAMIALLGAVGALGTIGAVAAFVARSVRRRLPRPSANAVVGPDADPPPTAAPSTGEGPTTTENRPGPPAPDQGRTDRSP